MTTVILTGTIVTKDPATGQTTGFEPGQLSYIFGGDQTQLTFQSPAPNDPNNPDPVTGFSPLISRIKVIGVDSHLQYGMDNRDGFVGDMGWDDNGTTRVATILYYTNNSGTDMYFVLDGEFPVLASNAAWDAFFSTQYLGFVPTTGAFAPNVPIPFSTFEAVPAASVSENDVIGGSNGDDKAGSGVGELLGGQGDDAIYAGDGDDTLRGGAGNDQLYGQNGNDFIDGGAGIDWLYYHLSTSGVEVYLNLHKSRGGEGYDRIYNIEKLGGSNHDDRLYGDVGVLNILGKEGNDIIKTKGAERASGGLGNDRIIGDTGNEILNGNDGDDAVFGLAGNDQIYGGNGADHLYGGSGEDTVFGGAGDDTIRGNRGMDILFGDDGSDRIYGGGGNDILHGDDGDDYLLGENGNDILNGGAGNDNMTGGAGADTFVFEEDSVANYDRVKDFENGVDKIDLSSFNFGSFADVQALASDIASGLKLNFGSGNVLLLEGFTLVDFDASDVML